MATDTDTRDPRDMTDEERAEFYSNIYRMPRIQPAAAAAGAPPDIGAAEPTGTMPRIKTPRITKPEAPAGSQQATEDELQDIRYRREHPYGTLGTPSGRSGVGGKILHGLATAGETALDVMRPGRSAEIPGSPANLDLREYMLNQRLQAQEKEASEAGYRGAEAHRAEAEARKAEWEMGRPELSQLTGPSTETPEGYTKWWDKHSQKAFWVGANEQPADVLNEVLQGTRPEAQPGPVPETAAPAAMPTIGQFPPAVAAGAAPEQAAPGTMPRITAPPPPMAAPTPAPPARRPGQLPAGVTPGAPKTMTPEQDLKNQFFAAANAGANRTPEQERLFQEHVGEWGKLVPATQADIDSAAKTMNDIYEKNRRVIGASTPHPPGIKLGENAEEIEKKQAGYEKLIADEVDRKQREIDAQPLKDIALQMKQEQLDKLKRDKEAEANLGYVNLYAQDNYNNAMAAWHKSPNYVRDLGFVNAIINDAKENIPRGQGLNTTTGALVGSAVGGPAGAAVGAIVGGGYEQASGIFRSIIDPIANGYLDAARKRGISDQGYAAMQAYFNALPARMAYELTTGGVKASSMRSALLVQKVMKTIPSPDTPRDVFGNAFAQYYKPMKAMTDLKYKREGFTPPAFKDIYGEEPTGGAGGHTFTYKGHPFVGVSDEMYNKYKGKPGFEEK